MTYTYEYTAPDQQVIVRSDGVFIPVDVENRDYQELIDSGAWIAPYRRWKTLAQATASLLRQAEDAARSLRTAVAGTDDATKLATYREKYDTAVQALAGDTAALAALEPEATARGETAAELAALVKALGDAWRAAGLAIDAAYQTHKAAITALPDLEAAEAYDLTQGWPT